ncbi:hypothetical protein GSI_12256 [Ganoderma sinense ZZ0214-1]|uniref:BTB domain-containing protein n=1 Tax=Ganoderma sinense ZZ0214-1 TaxID=1077348 RepID=A0A2G8RYV6_9APHY|nr:hypothetical protein GSI_12256 [Ganoderma sinense ZZ0214-1]
MSDPDTRPSKRTRLSTDDRADPQSSSSSSSSFLSSNLRRHPEIWYDDGNLVLVAGQTAFRIYRGLIAGQSTIFSDLFSSSSSSPDETFEGCPVIHLSDSPQDLVHFLRVLLPQSRTHYRTTREDHMRTFDELSAVVRLAHKYNVSQVLEQTLASLHDYGFVTSFAAYSRLPPNAALALDPWHNIGIVNLARLADTPSLLPLAFYRCAYLGSDVLNGCAREDGTIEHLSEADLRRCIDGRVAVVHEHTAFLCAVFDGAANPACTRPPLCASGLRNAQVGLLRMKEFEAKYHPLWPCWVEAVSQLGDTQVCPGCRGEMLERAKKGQKKFFDRLPEIFGIMVEGWGDEESETVVAAGEGE